MANPQLEHGHLELAHEIVESLAKIRISGTEWQVLWVILRKTYGWHKKLDFIPLSQFCVMTGLSRSHAIRSLKKLLGKKVIVAVRNEGGAVAYGFNKDFEEWESGSRKTPSRHATPHLTEARSTGGERAREEDKIVRDRGDTPENVEKETYGRYVRLTRDEHGRLAERFRAEALAEVIEFFDLKIESKGVRQWRRNHESDYATILYWERNGWIKLGRDPSYTAPGASPPVSASSCSIMGWAERERERLKQ